MPALNFIFKMHILYIFFQNKVGGFTTHTVWPYPLEELHFSKYISLINAQLHFTNKFN